MSSKVYQITTAREPSFRFVVELWAEVKRPCYLALYGLPNHQFPLF